MGFHKGPVVGTGMLSFIQFGGPAEDEPPQDGGKGQ